MSTVEEVEIEVESEPVSGELIVETPKEIPIKFNLSDARIQELKAELSGLKIETTQDYERVKRGIAVCRTLRGSVESCRKSLKEHALAYGRKVDAEANRLKAALEAIEEPLKIEKSKVDEAKEKAKREAEEAKKKIVEDRIKTLVELGEVPNPWLVAAWSDEQFDIEMNLAWDRYTDRKKAEEEAQARAANAEAERQEQLRIEREKIEAEKAELARLRAEESERQRIAEEKRNAELDRIAKAQAEERRIAAEKQAKIDEQNRLEREKIEAERRAVQEERERNERIERERVAAIEAERVRVQREEFERVERERLEEERVKAVEAEAARLEALKPDKEKLVTFANKLKQMRLPEVVTEEAKDFCLEIGTELFVLAEKCEDFGS